jgi:uncharacterized membrane protein
MNQVRRFLPALLIVSIMGMLSAYFIPQLPDSVATHFDMSGNPNQYSSKYVLLLMFPLLLLVMILTLPVLIRFTPGKVPRAGADQLVPRTLLSTGLLFLPMHFGFLHNARNPGHLPFSLWLTVGAGLFMISLAPALERSERNFLIGFRTPWSLSSEANWRATHRFGAKMLVITGILLLILAALSQTTMIVTVSSMLFAMITPVFYSLWYFQTMESKT